MTPTHPTESTPTAGRGRLAEVIATRGGLAAPEAPFVIEHREALIYMLCEAAELEHGIMCQYLFAAFSLKQTRDEGLTHCELTAVTRWRRQSARRHPGDAAPGAGAEPAVRDRRRTALRTAEPAAPAAHYPAGVNLRCSRSARTRCRTSCSWSGPRAWHHEAPKASRAVHARCRS